MKYVKLLKFYVRKECSGKLEEGRWKLEVLYFTMIPKVQRKMDRF